MLLEPIVPADGPGIIQDYADSYKVDSSAEGEATSAIFSRPNH